MSEIFVDAMVVTDDQRGFMSYMNMEDARNIQEAGGLSKFSSVNFRETTDRPIPQFMKEENRPCVMDVWVRMEPSKDYFLSN